MWEGSGKDQPGFSHCSKPSAEQRFDKLILSACLQVSVSCINKLFCDSCAGSDALFVALSEFLLSMILQSVFLLSLFPPVRLLAISVCFQLGLADAKLSDLCIIKVKVNAKKDSGMPSGRTQSTGGHHQIHQQDSTYTLMAYINFFGVCRQTCVYSV